MLVRASPFAVLALHDPGLVRVQLQSPTPSQPGRDRVSDPVRLFLCFAVDHHD
ncbi:hypothetical protein [Dactylosporangium sp. NPDC005555]|uniref:hypothetical protein n=1 Tax=Dactylosporangium sp. NPDC005555 TaxID=3154889 RepID=UPI0033B60C97